MKNMRNSVIDPVIIHREREESGERNEIGLITKYFNWAMNLTHLKVVEYLWKK